MAFHLCKTHGHPDKQASYDMLWSCLLCSVRGCHIEQSSTPLFNGAVDTCAAVDQVGVLGHDCITSSLHHASSTSCSQQATLLLLLLLLLLPLPLGITSMLEKYAAPGSPSRLGRGFAPKAMSASDLDYYQDRLQGIVRCAEASYLNLLTITVTPAMADMLITCDSPSAHLLQVTAVNSERDTNCPGK